MRLKTGITKSKNESNMATEKMNKKNLFPKYRKTQQTFYISGTIGTDAQSGKLPEDFSKEVMNILKKFEDYLTLENLTKNDIVKINIFLMDMANYAELNEVYSNFFADAVLPARTCIAVTALPHPDALVEMDLVAEVPA